MRRTRIPLRFLGPGRWRLRVFEENAAGRLQGRTRLVTRQDAIASGLAANRGLTAYAVPAGP